MLRKGQKPSSKPKSPLKNTTTRHKKKTQTKAIRRSFSIKKPSRNLSFQQDLLNENVSQGRKLSESAAFTSTRLNYPADAGEGRSNPLYNQEQAQSQQQDRRQRTKKSLFGDLNLEQAIKEDQQFMKRPVPDGKYLLQGNGQIPQRPPTKLKLNKLAIDKERVDLSSLEIQPYLENLKGAVIHHDLEQIMASISGVMKFGDRADLFDPRVDNEETIVHKLTANNEKHRKEYKVLLDNVRALTEVIMYDLEVVSDKLNAGSNLNKLHCTINTLQHLLSVYHIVPIPISDPNLKIEHCSLDVIAEQIVQRSEQLDITENGLDVYQKRAEYPPIPILSPLIGALYMMVLKRYGYTSGIVHTPMVGLLFATPPISRQNIADPDILARTQQSSPYWYINNVVTDHNQSYRKTSLKLTPVDCKSFCTPSIGANRTPEQLATDFTCSCLTQNEVGYGGNFIYIDFLVNRVGQIPYTYKPTNRLETLVTNNVDISTDTAHSQPG